MACSKPVLFVAIKSKTDASSLFPVVDDETTQHFRVVYPQDLRADEQVADKVVCALVFSVFVPIFASFFPKLTNLRVVYCVGVGLNDFQPLWEAFWARGIRFARAVEIQDKSCADSAFMLLMASAKKVFAGNEITHGKDAVKMADPPMGRDVRGATIGIVGMGAIGYHVATRARCFDMNVLYHNRNRRSVEEETLVGATYVAELHEMLSLSDFVVLTCDLNATTENLIAAKEFDVMKNSAVIINITRGQVIDQDALVHALKSGELGGAALDVTHPEPLPRDHPLLTSRFPNVIITPHTAAGTTRTRNNIVYTAIQQLKNGLEGKVMNGEITQEDYKAHL